MFLLNNGTKAKFTLKFNVATTDVIPCLFDAWTGSQEPIAVCDTNKDGLHISIALEHFQSRSVTFIQSDVAPSPHVLSHSENIAQVGVTPL